MFYFFECNLEGISVTKQLKKNEIIEYGFNSIKNEVFFTINGKLIRNLKFMENYVLQFDLKIIKIKQFHLILEIKNLNMILF